MENINENKDAIYYCEQDDPFCQYPNCVCNTVRPKEKQKQMYSKQQVLELMKQAFEAGFKKADTVEAGLEPKETEQEINWILLKQNNN